MITGHKSQSPLDIAETAQTNRKYGEEKIKITDIPDSPFKHVKQDDKEFIVLGNNIILECNLVEALNLVKNKDWNIIINTMAVIVETISNIKKQWEKQ